MESNVETRTKTREDAERWCRSSSVTRERAFGLLGLDVKVTLEDAHQEVMGWARARANGCPIRMGGASDLDLLFQLCEHLDATRVVETGVAFGWSSLAVLLSMETREAGSLYSVDLPYMEYRNDRWVGCVVPESMRHRWTLLRMADREGLPRILRASGSIDLAHYDSDKSEAGRSWAYPLLWGALRPGGILVSDDVGDNLAFGEFAALVNVSPLVFPLSDKFLGVICKPDSF